MNCQYGIKELPETLCSNEARYFTEEGRFVCGVCDTKTGCVSVRLSDLPMLLHLLGDVAKRRRKQPGSAGDELYTMTKMLELISKRGVTF